MRGGYGLERYEHAEIQSKVRGLFATIGDDVGREKWRIVDAGRSEGEVTAEVLGLVQRAIETDKRPVDKLWID